MKLYVDLTPQQERQLSVIAERLNVAPEALAAAALRDLIEQRAAEFEQAASRVLEKNGELYRRLA